MKMIGAWMRVISVELIRVRFWISFEVSADKNYRLCDVDLESKR